MEAKKTKMCKVRLRRLRSDLVDKKRTVSRADVQFISSSSESEEDELMMDEFIEKISVQLKSPLALTNNKDFDPYVLLTEAQACLNLSNENQNKLMPEDEKMDTDVAASNTTTATTSTTTINSSSTTKVEKPNKKPKHRKKQKSHYYPPLEESGGGGLGGGISTGADQFRTKPTIVDYDLIYYHSDDQGPCSYNCNHARAAAAHSTAAVLALAPTDRRSSSGSSSSLSSDKCSSISFSKLFDRNCISVMDDENPPTALSKILSIKEFDPLAPQHIVAIIIKSIVSLSEFSRRDDNIIKLDIDKRRIMEFSAMSPEEKKNCRLNPFMDVSNVVVTHTDDEFFTFCLCKNCEEYREFVIHIMVEQFKAAHMVVMLLDVLIKSYGPMLKNITAYNKFEKLLDSNKEIYWITCGVLYHKKAEHLDFIYDEYLSDNMIFVLFSSILMLNNPLLLLQILAFHVECIVKAYAEGFLEIVEPDKNKIPADEMINYILNGYDDLMRISEQVASYLFAFENDFLRKFSLTWKLLCQRLYQQHVHLHLEDTMLACIITLKEEELTSHHTDLIKRYIQFDDFMDYVEKRWTDVWIELNKFNLSEVERKRRKSLLDVYRIFDTVVQDAIGFSLQDSVDDNDFYDFRSLKNRRLAWKNIMSYTKMKWPDGFFQPPNTLVVDDKCQTCNVSLEYHADYCKCITCSIAGGPLPPRRNADGKCSKCLAHSIVEKDVNFYDSKILNVCANDDFQNLVTKYNNGAKTRKNTALQEVGQELYSTLVSVEEMLSVSDYDTSPESAASMNNNGYHISWAVFNHLNNRKRFPHTTIEEQHFCRDCKLPSCLLARKILNNEISPSLSQDLVHYYQPMTMSREELRSILPNIMLYNRKLVASNNGLDLIDVHDLVVKIYWIFIISIYAIYFIDFDNNVNNNEQEDEEEEHEQDQDQEHNGEQAQGGTTSASSIMEALELTNNDIRVNVEKITGNKDDTKFLEFLDKVKSLSPYNNDVESNFEPGVNINSAEMQKKLNDILKIPDDQEISSQCDNIPPPIMTPTEEDEEEQQQQQLQPSELIPPSTVEAQPKKSCKEKTKKCCFDHSDMGDHCKENHSSKKRLKKDCNHARMNETRDRLRKKLSQIVNARKNTKPSQIPPPPVTPNSTSTPSASTSAAAVAAVVATEPQNPMENVLNPDELKLFQQFQQQLPQPSSWDAHAIAATFEHIHTEAKRNENLHNLCECLQHLQTNPKGGDAKSSSSSGNGKKSHNHNHSQHNTSNSNNSQIQATQQQTMSSSLEPPNKRSNLSNNSTRDASTSSQGTKSKERIINPISSSTTTTTTLCQSSTHHQQQTNNNNNATTTNTTTATTSPSSKGAANNNLDFVSEICEIIDNYSKEQAKRKWIKETLSFIEGPTTPGGGKKKLQPQTLNPKKAAKKAKQKQRKEEEKRITELQDFRAQFHNIYFKEFSEKINLKSLKANKKRDKKKISELESNIKNLQRAKAKVETAILELIATVKQTNGDFKFPYLPTKEQQVEKMRELEAQDTANNSKDGGGNQLATEAEKTIKIRNLQHHAANEHPANTVGLTPPTSSPFTLTPTNNLNMVPETYSMPYAHANHFPYNLGFPPPAAPAPFGLMRATPMCYAPPAPQPATAAALATAHQQQQQQPQLAPDVVAAMAANVAGNNTIDPSKRIVTIRRVNLPNVPEPQVTVTAKGTSPDKDKLLYTFINGQLIQTGTAPPITMPQMPVLQTQTPPPLPPPHHLGKMSAEHLLTIPPPPPPKLSKTQLKKERKRMAKLQAELEAAEEAERKRLQEEQEEEEEKQRLLELEEQRQLELQQQQLQQQQQQQQTKQQPKKKKKNSAAAAAQQKQQQQQQQQQQKSKLSCCPNNKDMKNNKNTLCNSNSTTSVSTNENTESPQLPQMMAIKKSAKQKRSDSTTTSCSAATSTSSNNSTSSQMNTRDNSVSSLKPQQQLKAAINNSKQKSAGGGGGAKEQKPAAVVTTQCKNKNKTKQLKPQQQKLKQNKKPARVPPTPSTTSSSDAEPDEEEEAAQEREEVQETPATARGSSTTRTQKLGQNTAGGAAGKSKTSQNKQKNLTQKSKTPQKPIKSITPPSSDTEPEPDPEPEHVAVAMETEPPPQIKEPKKRRPKLVDNGQFDNNPFKSLHMQDSETECSSAEENEEDGDDDNNETDNETQNKTTMAANNEQKVAAIRNNVNKSKREEEQITNTAPATAGAAATKTNARIQKKKEMEENKLSDTGAASLGQIAKLSNNKLNNKNNKNERTNHHHQQQQQQSSIKQNNMGKIQQQHAAMQEDVNRTNAGNVHQRLQEKSASSSSSAQPTNNYNRKTKNEARPTNFNNPPPPSTQVKTNNKQTASRSHQTIGPSPSLQSSSCKPQNNRNNTRNNSNRNQSSNVGGGGGQHHIEDNNQQHNLHYHHHQNIVGNQHPMSSCGSNMENKQQQQPSLSSTSKRSQRNKKYQQKSQKHSSMVTHHHQHQNCCSTSGIPNNMGYFNPNDINLIPSPNPHHHQHHTATTTTHNASIQNHSYQSLAEQMQALRLSGHQVSSSSTAAATAQQRQQHINSANVSIMDQLNRGVQVENLSLPPGITLTKVDPIKSEQLRQKSESIKKLAKPLQQQQQQQQQHHHHHNLSQNPQTFHHSSGGATIIAPPVNPITTYYGSHYGNAAAGIDPQSGIIMVEANPPKSSNIAGNPPGTTSKQSKNKKRRNKSKANNMGASCSMGNSGNIGNVTHENNISGGQPKMITLRNPMFHGGPAAGGPANILQQPSLIQGRPADGYSMPTSLSADQPAAIIKNENGMYTIRNPALHQAVTSGLSMGGYRQFGGNVNYYTPQEAAAEAARATRLQQQQQQHQQEPNEGKKSSTTSGSNTSAAAAATSSSFSYFSNDTVQTNTPHNNISISCTSIGGAEVNSSQSQSVCGLTGDAAVIQRPQPHQRPISAIGSEIKSAQQQKQKTKVEQQWSNFGTDAIPLNKNDNLSCNTSFLSNDGTNPIVGGTVTGSEVSLQEKYQQSKYYNGFDVFTGSSGGSSSSAATGGGVHIHHSCGDDSPPPSMTGYNSYLDGIPNTGVIRYDDASFLKNLIPGQNLNTEVSIHNVNDSNFTRNAQSPQAHRVEITPVFGNRPPSTNLYETTAGQTNQTSFRGNYRDPLNDYNNDSNIFPNNNLHLNLNDLENSMKYDFETKPPTSSVAVVAGDNSHNSSILGLNDLLHKNGPTGPASHRTSPYMDENSLEGFVQNMNSLQITTAATSTDEQSSQLNGGSSGGGGHCVGQHGTAAATNANPANGWW